MNPADLAQDARITAGNLLAIVDGGQQNTAYAVDKMREAAHLLNQLAAHVAPPVAEDSDAETFGKPSATDAETVAGLFIFADQAGYDAVVNDIDLLRAILRKHLYALNDGFIIPCLLDLSAAVGRIAKATNCAPCDHENMAQRVEEMTSERPLNFWRALDAAEVTRDHRGMFFRALDMRETMQDIKRIDRRGGPQRQGLHPMDPARIGHDIGTRGWHREQALYADKTGIRTDGTGLPRQDDIGGQVFNGSKYNAESVPGITSHVAAPPRNEVGDKVYDQSKVRVTYQGIDCGTWDKVIKDTDSHVTVKPFVSVGRCSNCGCMISESEKMFGGWCDFCRRNP